MTKEVGCCVCFSNKRKACCATFVLYTSCFLALLGLFAAIYPWIGVDMEETWELASDTEKWTFPSPSALFGIIATLAGLFSIVTAILGCLAAKYKKCCFTLPFMIAAIIVSLVMLIVAAAILAARADTESYRKVFCSPDEVEDIKIGDTKYPSLEDYMMEMYGGSVDRYMCTQLCPCDVKHEKAFRKALNTEKDGKRGFQITKTQYRVNDPADLTPEDIAAFQSDPETFMKTSDSIPMHYVDPDIPGNFAFDSFLKCWDDKDNGLKIALKAQGVDVDNIDIAIKFFGGIETNLETCSGACHKPLFGISSTIADGPVAQECVTHIIEGMKDLLGLGIACLITFFILFAATMGSITLCRGYNKEEESEEEDGGNEKRFKRVN